MMDKEHEYCRNCKRQIARSNYVIHGIHCERNIQICELCSEPVPSSNMQEHMDKDHSLSACLSCSMPVEKWMIENHMQTCPKQAILCDFCELEYPLDGMEEHVKICGARTEKCDACNSYVMLRDLKSHNETCNKYEQCKFCQSSFPALIYITHLEDCPEHPYECELCLESILYKNKGRHEASECKAIHEEEYDCYENSSKREESHAATIASYKTDVMFEHQTEWPHDIGKIKKGDYLPEAHGKCNEKEKINEQNASKLLIKHTANTECIDINTKDLERKVSGREECNNSNFIPGDILPHHESSNQVHLEKEFVWCPHCNNKIPANRLLKHKTYCSIKKKICAFCNESIPIAQEELHLIKCITKINSNTSGEKKMEKYIKQDKGYLEKEFEWCPYCSNKIPMDRFKKHKTHCSVKEKICAFCEDIISIAEDSQHLFKCLENKMKDTPDWKQKTDSKDYVDEASKLCNYCSNKIPVNQFQKHKTYCLEKKKICAFCKESIPILEEELHLKECANKIINDTSDENLCKMCSIATINAVFLDCGHMAACFQCSQMFLNCPVCRQTIVRVVRVFRA